MQSEQCDGFDFIVEKWQWILNSEEYLFCCELIWHIKWKALKIESSFFHLNPEVIAKLFDLIYYLIRTPTLTLTPQLSPNLP